MKLCRNSTCYLIKNLDSEVIIHKKFRSNCLIYNLSIIIISVTIQ